MSQIKVGDAARTPLHESLRQIPRGAKYTWTDEDGYYHSVPIGSLAHQAADRLDAEPEEPPRGGMEEQPDGGIVFMEEPQPSAQVTREDLAGALYLVRESIRYNNPEYLTPEINRLRAQEEGE